MLNGVAVQAVFLVLIAVGAWIAVGGDINPITLVAILGLAAPVRVTVGCPRRDWVRDADGGARTAPYPLVSA